VIGFVLISVSVSTAFLFDSRFFFGIGFYWNMIDHLFFLQKDEYYFTKNKIT